MDLARSEITQVREEPDKDGSNDNNKRSLSSN